MYPKGQLKKKYKMYKNIHSIDTYDNKKLEA